MYVNTGDKRRRLILRHTGTGLVASALLAAGVMAGISAAGHPLWKSAGAWAVAWLVGLTLVTFAYYGFDKARARTGGRRVPEAALHLLALLGGTGGALCGMYYFRHKTVKGSFRIVFWLILILQVATAAYLVKVTTA
jgi:uncharacterized membrane protein YsdA (DUF1294 family)